ncbi:hypothetical protein [Croceicoccus ponticola]|nr:hypothetical protein [Croceicoccus ponticola]
MSQACDTLAIMTLTADFARGVDRGGEALLLSLFEPTAYVDLGLLR